MGERELFEFWSDTYKIHHVAWSQEKAALVLETWQRRFSEVSTCLTFKNYVRLIYRCKMIHYTYRIQIHYSQVATNSFIIFTLLFFLSGRQQLETIYYQLGWQRYNCPQYYGLHVHILYCVRYIVIFSSHIKFDDNIFFCRVH